VVPRESFWCACFHALPEDWLINRPQNVRVRSGESSIKRLFFRVPSVQSPRCFFERRATYLGSCPRLTSPHCTHAAKRPPSCWRPPPVISTVRRLLQCGLRACFIPQPSSGPCLVQGFVHFVRPSAFIKLVTPLPFNVRALTCKQAATHEHLDSDALLHTKPLAVGLVFSRASGCSPLRVFCSPRFIYRRRRQLPVCDRSCRFLFAPLRASEEVCIGASKRDFSAFPTKDLDSLLPEPPTCPSFSDLPSTSLSKSRNPTSNRPRLSTLRLLDRTRDPKTLGSDPKPRSFKPTHPPLARSDVRPSSSEEPSGRSPGPIEHRAG